MNALHVFVTILFFIGIFLLVSYGFISQTNADAPADSTVTRAILGIYTIGIIFLTLGVVMLFLSSTCSGSQKNPFASYNFYIIFIGMLGLTLLVLGSTVYGKGDTSDSTTNGLLISIIMIGIFMFLLSAGIKTYEYRKKIPFFGKSSSSSSDSSAGSDNLEDMNDQIEKMEAAYSSFKIPDNIEEQAVDLEKMKRNLETSRKAIEQNKEEIKKLEIKNDKLRQINDFPKAAEASIRLKEQQKKLENAIKVKDLLKQRTEALVAVSGLTSEDKDKDKLKENAPMFGGRGFGGAF